MTRWRALLGWSAVLAIGGCAGPRPTTEPTPTAVMLPTPGFTPVFFHDTQLPASARESERARCIDAELARRELNEFGDARGTVYRDGAPVGVKSTTDRYTYAVRRNPDIATRCTRAPGEPSF